MTEIASSRFTAESLLGLPRGAGLVDEANPRFGAVSGRRDLELEVPVRTRAEVDAEDLNHVLVHREAVLPDGRSRGGCGVQVRAIRESYVLAPTPPGNLLGKET